MAAPPEPSEDALVVEIEGKGVAEDKILSYRINSSYVIPTDSWEIVVYSESDPRGLRRRWRPLQPVRLLISGRQQLIGRIDGTEGVGESGAALRVFGRDYLSDIVDSTIDPTFQVKQGQDVGAVVLDVLKPWGITTVFGHNLNRNILTGKAPFQPTPRDLKRVQLQDFAAKWDQGTSEFLNIILAHQGLTFQPAGTRDAVVVDSPNYEQSALYRLARSLDPDRPGNMTKPAAARRDYAGVPTVTLTSGRTGGSEPGQQSQSGRQEYPTFDKAGPSRIGASLEAQRTITSDDGVVVVREKRFDPRRRDSTVYGFDFPVYKPLFYQDKQARDQAQLDASVRRMIAEKLRDTLQYPFQVRGHVDPVGGAVWTVDTIVDVQDEIEDVEEPLWIVERSLYNDGSGPMTEGLAIRPGSYVF